MRSETGRKGRGGGWGFWVGVGWQGCGSTGSPGTPGDGLVVGCCWVPAADSRDDGRGRLHRALLRVRDGASALSELACAGIREFVGR